MTPFTESNFYKALQDFFINNYDKNAFLEMLAEFYNRTQGIIDNNISQDNLIRELQELFKKFNEEGIDENIVREKVEYFLNNSSKIVDIYSQINHITRLIKGNLKQSFETLSNFTNVKLSKGDYTLDGEVIVLDGKENIVIDLTDCTINQTRHGYGVIELVNCKNIIIKGGKLIGRGEFPANTLVGTKLYNEKRGLQGVPSYEWEFHKNGELTTTQEYNGGYIGNCGIGILINYNCENIIIENVESSYFNYSGISIGFKATQDNGYNKNIEIKNCYSHHNFDSGIQLLNVKDYTVENNRSEYNGHPAFKIDDYEIDPGYGITLRGARKHSIDGIIKNNTCNSNNRKGIDVHSGVDFIIRDNIINDTPMTGISITQSNVGMLISRGIIENNVIKNCGYMESVGGFGQGVYLASEDYLIFRDNILYKCGVNSKNIKANGITAVNGDIFIENNVLTDCGYSSDINVKTTLGKIVNNTIKDTVNSNDRKISIYAYTDDLVNSYLTIDKNYINIKNGRGIGFQKFADGLMTRNKIIAPVQVSHVDDENLRANVRISEDNNLTKTVYKVESTKGLDITNTHSFEVTLTNGVLTHTGNRDIISSVVDNVNGFRINYTKELKNVGVSLTIANSTTGLDLTNLYLRENTRNYSTVALGTSSNTAGVSSSTLGKNIKILVMLTYI